VVFTSQISETEFGYIFNIEESSGAGASTAIVK